MPREQCHKLCIAPMMQYTDMHDRYLLRLISKKVFLYTEMIATGSLVHGKCFEQLEFNNLAIAINVGTNIPSIATPNGQAAFLFLLTSALAPLINLSYLRMVYMALPYTIILSIVGYISIANIL